jgi:hypothetical protein
LGVVHPRNGVPAGLDVIIDRFFSFHKTEGQSATVGGFVRHYQKKRRAFALHSACQSEGLDIETLHKAAKIIKHNNLGGLMISHAPYNRRCGYRP